MLRRLILAVVVFIVVTLIVYLLGSLCLAISEATINSVGTFLHQSSGIIGFLAGICYFFFGNGTPRLA